MLEAKENCHIASMTSQGPRWGYITSWIAVGCAFLFGALFRVVHYVGNRSFWLDEALLAQNIVDRNFYELTRPLDFNQGAPIGFLWLIEISTRVFGETETAMRLVPFIAGLLILPLLAWFAYRTFGLTVSANATAMAAVSPTLVYYAAELKQYGVDAAVALIILVVAREFSQRSTSKAGIMLVCVGTLATWFSHAAVFILAASGLWLLLTLQVRKRKDLQVWATLVSLSWATSFLIHYFLFLRQLAQNEVLLSFWKPAFLPFPPTSIGDLQTYLSALINIFELSFTTRAPIDTTGIRVSMLALGLWIIGLYSLTVSNRKYLMLLLTPYLLVLVASVFEKYPARERLLVFYVPIVLLVIAVALGELQNSNDRLARSSGLALSACLIALPFLYNMNSVRQTPAVEEVRPALQAIAENSQKGDSLYVYWETNSVVKYYDSVLKILPKDIQVVFGTSPSLTSFSDQLAKIKSGRLWVLYSHVRGEGEANEAAALLASLQNHWPPLSKMQFEGAHLLLFENFQTVER